MEAKVNDIHEREQFWQKYIFQIIIIIFMAGGGWITLSNVQALAEDNKEAIEEAKEEANDVTEKLARIETKQEYIQRDLEQAKEVARANSEKLDRILEELRKED